MNNDTDDEPEDDLIKEHLAGPIELMERNGWKVTGVRIDVKCNRAQHFVVVPVDDQATTTDDFSALLRDAVGIVSEDQLGDSVAPGQTGCLKLTAGSGRDGARPRLRA